MKDKIALLIEVFLCSLFIAILSGNIYADEFIDEEVDHSPVSIKNIIKDPILFEKFAITTLKTIQFKNPSEVQLIILKATKDLPIQSLLKKEIFFSEFLYRISLSKKAIPKVLSILVERVKLIIFSIFIIITFIVSMLLAEVKVTFKVLSLKRITYSLIRFSSINMIRVWGFIYLFSENITPIFDVYINTIADTKESYPILFKANFILSMLL